MHKDHSLDIIYSRTVLSTLEQQELEELLCMISKKLSISGLLCLGFFPSEHVQKMKGSKHISTNFSPLNEHYQSVVGLNTPVRFWGKDELKEVFSSSGFVATPVVDFGSTESAVLVGHKA